MRQKNTEKQSKVRNFFRRDFEDHNKHANFLWADCSTITFRDINYPVVLVLKAKLLI